MTAVEPAWAAHLPPASRAGDVDLLHEGSLPAAFARSWQRHPGAPRLHLPGRGWVSGAELDEVTAGIAARLGAIAARGDRVLLCGPTSYELIVAYLGVLRAGLVCLPVNPAYSAREVAHIVEDAAPTVVLSDLPEVQEVARRVGSPALVGGLHLDGGPGAVPDLPCPEDGALLLYTSGTTGAPKGALLSHANLLATAEGVRLAWRWTPSDRLLLALPLFHAHGLCVGLNGTLLTEAEAVVLDRFDPIEVLAAVRETGASMFFGVPTMYHRLVGTGRVGELAGLRLCVSGSAPLPESVHRAFAAEAGHSIVERYGTTETLMNCSNPYDGERRAGTVGMPFPGVEVRLAEGTDEILISGPNVFSGYWNRPDLDASTFDGAWFKTGDIGSFDDDGYLRIRGRSKELIISGGFNVYPKEVEEVLSSHPGVGEAAVAGVPSDEWGEVVTAFIVVSHGEAVPPDLDAFARAHLAGYKVPRAYHVVRELPRNAMGKVVRSELRAP